ncbi:MAG TPA: AAA family ATPase, partial [Candidatus Mucispirillum faecigallinarum]|nr:AAA family ATPase [Candidatus Mucispirillum faecigallinarum]
MLNKYDIYLYSSNNNKFENKTAEIESCFFTDSMLNVVFKNSIDYKVYTYSKDKYILKPHANSYTFLNYLYEISKEKNNFNSEDTLLYNIYSHFINQSISQESALFSFLKTKQIKRYKLKNVLIFPFSTNKSQCEAVEKAFSSQITVIEGPPGTGKTQTILNIIANIILNNKTVAVVSNNNDAATNIYEKLSKDNLHFMCARLGNKNNKEEFIKNQSDEYPSVLKNDLNINTKEIKQKILTTYKKVLEIFDSEIKIANYNKELHDLKLEYNHFKNDKKIENNEDNMLQFSLENISKLASYKSILK